MTKILGIFILVSSFWSVASWASETVKGAQKDVAAFKVEMSKKLDEIEIRLKELKVKASEKGSETQARLVAELEATRDKLRAQTQNLSAETQTGWQKMKKSVAESADALNARLQNALKD